MTFLHKVLLLILTICCFVAAAPLGGSNNSRASACQQLEEKFGIQTSLLGSDEYVAGIVGMCFPQSYS